MSEPFRFWADVESRGRSSESPADRIASRNRFIRDSFEADIRRVGWNRLTSQQHLPNGVDALVLGVVTWSRKDMELLAGLASLPQPSAPIFIFDLDDVRSLEDLDRYIPGVPLPVETPVFAQYRSGRLVRSGSGAQVETELLPLQANGQV
jgi:hypothetical protein